MNKNTETLANSPAAYGILNPHPVLARRDSEGRISEIVNNRYGMLDVFAALAEAGLITIHEQGTNDLASQYGRTNVLYSIN